MPLPRVRLFGLRRSLCIDAPPTFTTAHQLSTVRFGCRAQVALQAREVATIAVSLPRVVIIAKHQARLVRAVSWI